MSNEASANKDKVHYTEVDLREYKKESHTRQHASSLFYSSQVGRR
jgi:hypothetical protein